MVNDYYYCLIYLHCDFWDLSFVLFYALSMPQHSTPPGSVLQGEKCQFCTFSHFVAASVSSQHYFSDRIEKSSVTINSHFTILGNWREKHNRRTFMKLKLRWMIFRKKLAWEMCKILTSHRNWHFAKCVTYQ